MEAVKRILLTILAGVVLGAGPAGASVALTIKPSAQVYPKQDGYKDSIFIEHRLDHCAASGVLTIRNTSTSELVFRDKGADSCYLGFGVRWWGRYDWCCTGPHVPYGEYKATVRIVYHNGSVERSSKLIYVRAG